MMNCLYAKTAACVQIVFLRSWKSWVQSIALLCESPKMLDLSGFHVAARAHMQTVSSWIELHIILATSPLLHGSKIATRDQKL